MRTTIHHFGIIQDPNTSGQGFCSDHVNHPINLIAKAYKYKYSHSVYVTYPGDKKVLFHCYKHESSEHILSFPHHNENVIKQDNREHIPMWQTSTSTGSGRNYIGNGYKNLGKHLKNKNKRYKLNN